MSSRSLRPDGTISPHIDRLKSRSQYSAAPFSVTSTPLSWSLLHMSNAAHNEKTAVDSFGRDGDVISATVLLAQIPALANQSAPQIVGALVSLQNAIRDTPLWQNREATLVYPLASHTGVILIVPDRANTYIHHYVDDILSALYKHTVSVRIGVAWGTLELLEDSDDNLNAIGTPINVAARLAYSTSNPGFLFDSSYVQFSSATLDPQQSFGPFGSLPTLSVKGKAHDTHPFQCKAITADRLTHLTLDQSRTGLTESALRRTSKTFNGVVVAYDLPKFSQGDRSQLSKRFRSTVDAFKKLRRHDPSRDRMLHFSPGGDGGIAVFEADRTRGYDDAVEFAKLLAVESEGKSDRIEVNARIGLHYGGVVAYESLNGVYRPTGRSCFIADAITGDEVAKEANSVVFTETMADIVSNGSTKYLREHFRELPPLEQGPAAGLRRYVARHIGRSEGGGSPSIGAVSLPGSSWYLDDSPS